MAFSNLPHHLLANVSTYNLLLMAVDDSECQYKWDRSMELVKCMAQEPMVHPNKSLNFKYLFLLVEVVSCLLATFNMLLKLSEHSGKASRETAVAIFQEMLHVGIG